MHLLLFADTIQLFPDGTIFIHIALILFMIWVLNRTFYKPINDVIAAREKNKGGHAGEAAGILKSVEEKETKYRESMLEARTEGYSMIESEQKAALEDREKQLAAVKAEVADRLSAGRSEIETQTAAAHATLGGEAETLAGQIAANILKG